MGRIKKAHGLVVPKFLDLRIIDLNNLGTGWSVSLNRLSDFAKLCIERRGELSPQELNYWSAQIACSMDRVLGFLNLSVSISGQGYKHPFDYFEEYVQSGQSPDLPRVTPDDLLDDGRHRVAILRALGISQLPVYMIRLEGVKREHQVPARWGTFRSEAFRAATSFACSRQWYEYRRGFSYEMCNMKVPEKEIPRMYSRSLPNNEKKKKWGWFRRKKK